MTAAPLTAECRQGSSATFLIQAHLHYGFTANADVLLHCEAAALPGQALHHTRLDLIGAAVTPPMPGHGGVGSRRWLRVTDRLQVDYAATASIRRADVSLDRLGAAAPHQLPGTVLEYLMPSRYCPSDRLYQFVGEQFAGLTGGPLAAAICHWIDRNISYGFGASHVGTAADDTIASRMGTCRDFTHVLIAMARAAWIPARYVSVYAPAVNPQDFHAVAELFLDGRWHLIDPTGMAQAADMIIIGCGRDAADVPFLSSFGAARLIEQWVTVTAA